MPSLPARTRLAPDARRAQLLDCAMAAFAEHGVARATHSHVARLAGVSVPTVHAYFRTREDLVAAVLDATGAWLVALCEDSLADLPARQALWRLGSRFVAAAPHHADLIRVWLDWSTGVRADVWPRYLVVLERMHAAVRAALQRGKDAGDLASSLDEATAARLFIGGGHTSALMLFSGASAAELARFVDDLVASIMALGRVDAG
ncbi:TetR/AcrR family transcriptional regulator [Zavarzinia sp. CC-PAN008]|uniref:TetR/AcrR family transcriptional regulator n=1 Tax=Zavarzinia sp. CC-PAN008 TaxID=3243332 RepID=UPI003F749699